jgi:hypothetical protein
MVWILCHYVVKYLFISFEQFFLIIKMKFKIETRNVNVFIRLIVITAITPRISQSSQNFRDRISSI